MTGSDPLEFAEVLALLEHGSVLVDRVVRCEPGVVIETWKAITGAEPCYAHLPAGLAPEVYDYPEELLLETFAQSARLLWSRTGGPASPDLGGTRGVTFHASVRPGAIVRMVVRLIPATATTAFFSGRAAEVDGPLVMTVDNLVLTVRDADALIAG